MNEFEKKGIFWLPDNPNKKVSGVLRYSLSRGVELELFDRQIDLTSFIEFHPIVNGETLDRNLITLSGCEMTGETAESSNAAGIQYAVALLFEGDHFREEKDVLFDTMKIKFYNLEQWIGHRPFSIMNKNTKELTKLHCEFTGFKDIRTTMDDFQLAVESEAPTFCDLEELHIKNKININIRIKEKTYYAAWRERILIPLQNFLTLGMAATTCPLSISASSEERRHNYPGSPSVPREVGVYSSVNLKPEKQSSYHMFFPFPEIAKDFEKYLNAWFILSKPENLGPGCNLFFEVFNAHTLPLKHQFLTLAQSLEAFHRRTTQAVDRRLQGDSRPEFEERVYQLLALMGDIRQQLIKDDESFVSEIAATREALMHWDVRDQQGAKDSKSCYELVRQMKFVFLACVLLELGMEQDKIASLVRKYAQGLARLIGKAKVSKAVVVSS